MAKQKIAYGLITLSATAFVFFAGFTISDPTLFPSATISKAKSAVYDALDLANDAGDGGNIVWSIFLPFESEEHPVPVERPGAGGGLTIVDGSLIVLTHEGRFFAFDDTGDIRPLDISAPENGFSRYVTLTNSTYKHLNHAPQFFRFNDLLHYETDERNGLLLSYTKWFQDEDCYGTAVAKASLPENKGSLAELEIASSDWEIIFRTEPCLPLKDSFRAIEGHMAGGRLAFLPPNKVLLGSGDYHWDGMYAPLALSQDPNNDYGKIIEIDIESGKYRHLSIGNRNVQGIAVSESGEIWAVEHGPRGGDELNRIVTGANYGWPLESYGTRYNRLPLPEKDSIGRHVDFDPPFYAWLPSIGVSNITPITDFHPSWDGDLLVASLSAQSLFRLRQRDDRIVFAERIDVGHRIRYAHQFGQDALALWTDQNSLLILRKAGELVTGSAMREIGNRLPFDDERRQRLQATIAACNECHSFEHGDDANAPHLADVFGRSIASTAYRDYSTSLSTVSGNWDEERLRSFLSDPEVFAPGTTMPPPGLSEEAISDLITTLELLSRPE